LLRDPFGAREATAYAAASRTSREKRPSPSA